MVVWRLKSLGAPKTCGDPHQTQSLTIVMVAHDADMANYAPRPVALVDGAMIKARRTPPATFKTFRGGH